MSLITRPRGPMTLAGTLLTQVEPQDALALREVTDVPGGGLVISGKSALMVAEYLSGRGYGMPLLVDRQLYKGKRRRSASDPFDPTWIARQKRLNLPAVVPDAGYVAKGDLPGLQSVLGRCSEIEGGVALLALGNWWTYDIGLKLLHQELRDIRVPIALVLEHRKDPLGVYRILNGVVSLLKAGVTLLALRCDTSSLGLIAHGALAAAYGSKTSLRHLYPNSDGGGGGGGTGKESGFWPAGMAFHYTDLLYDAASASPHDPRWTCSCDMCKNTRLDRLETALVEDVRRHNTASLLREHRDLIRLPAGKTRQQWWKLRCEDAEAEHDIVSAGSVVVQCPLALKYWQKV